MTTWHKDQPEDIKAANESISKGGLGWKAGGSNLDAYIEKAFEEFLKSSAHTHWNFLVYNSCKYEAKDLIARARELNNIDHPKPPKPLLDSWEWKIRFF